MGLQSKASRWPKIVRHLVDGPKTIGQLSEVTGAKDSAVTRNIALLVDEGLVREGDRIESIRGGRPARLWEWVQE